MASGAAVFFLAGCSSAGTVGHSPATNPLATNPLATYGSPCMNPHPGRPSPVQPAVPGVSADGDIAASWSLDNAITVEPADGASPVISRQRALCTLLAAEDIRGSDLLEDGSGLTLILGKVTVPDALLVSNIPTDAALTAFHSRLAWIAVVDPPILAACPSTPPPVSSSSSSGDDASSAAGWSPQTVPYQLVVLDAATGTDGLVYAARTNNPCASGLAGPYVRPLIVAVSVPWRLISRDPGGLFGTIALTVHTCDEFGSGANATDAGVVEVEVSRPITNCGSSKESVQTLQGPAFGDPLAANLTHAATGFADMPPPPQAFRSGSADATLCAEAFSDAPEVAAVAASYPVTVDDLRQISAGPSPGVHPFAVELAAFPGGDQAAWCEVKVGTGYLISAVTPDGAPLAGVQHTTSTFQPLPAGIPALP